MANPLFDNIGNIELINKMGTDLDVANAARVSFSAYNETFTNKDRKLLTYLAKHEHTSPFRHVSMSFRIKAPLYVRTQWIKHLIGSRFHDEAWNEVSGRYVTFCPTFYLPHEVRQQAKSSKQASVESDMADWEQQVLLKQYKKACNTSFETYEKLIDAGMAREQARGVLPETTYTEWLWTSSLQGVLHFVSLRDDPHAQWEIQQYAKEIRELVKGAFPASYEAFIAANKL